MMVNMHGVEIQSLVSRLMEKDSIRRRVSDELAKKTLQIHKTGDLYALASFLETIGRQRETILYEMAKLGLSEGDVYRALRTEAEKREEAARCTG